MKPDVFYQRTKKLTIHNATEVNRFENKKAIKRNKNDFIIKINNG